MVGDGPDRAAAERHALDLKVAEDVVFLGKVKNPIEPLLISDLLVLPSETESFGLVALEAFAAGVPVISTDVGGLPEVNLHGKTGMLRPVGDVEGMAKDALHVLDSAHFPSFHEAALQQGRSVPHSQDPAPIRGPVPQGLGHPFVMKSHRIGERIVVSRSGDRWMATISGAIPDWQRQSLELWLGAWGALGAMLAYGAWSFPGGERQFYLICMGFWAFFAMRGWKAVRWRRSGQEVVQLSQDGLSIRLDHGERPAKPPRRRWKS